MTSRFSSSTSTYSVSSSGNVKTSKLSSGGMSSAGISTGMSSGGMSSAGMLTSSGGMSTGGGAMSSGGMSSAGISTGMSSGGMSSAGMSTAMSSGGMSSAGMSTSSGGMSTGGGAMSSGGMSSAGMSTGMSSGGMSSAGMSTAMSSGGMSSAGMSTGMSSGGMSSGGGAMSSGGMSSAGMPTSVGGTSSTAFSAIASSQSASTAKHSTVRPSNSKPKTNNSSSSAKLFLTFDPPTIEMQKLKAMRTRDPERVRQLMHRGQVLQALTEQGNLREIQAALKGFRKDELLSWFVVRMFKTAFERGHYDILFFMMREGFDFRHVALRNTLHAAAETGEYNFRCLDLVIRAGMDVNFMARPMYFTPLHIACLHKRLDLVQLFVHHKADVNAVAQDNSTPIVCAERQVSDEASAALSKKIILILQSKGGRRDWRKNPKPAPVAEEPEYVRFSMSAFSASDDDDEEDEAEDVLPPKAPVKVSSSAARGVGVGCSTSGVRVDAGSSPATASTSTSSSSSGFSASQRSNALAAVTDPTRLEVDATKTIMADTRLIESLKSMGIGIETLLPAAKTDTSATGGGTKPTEEEEETEEVVDSDKDTKVVGAFWT